MFVRSKDLWTSKELRDAIWQAFWMLERSAAADVARHQIMAAVTVGIGAFGLLYGVARSVAFDLVHVASGLARARQWDRRLEGAAGVAVVLLIGCGWVLSRLFH